MSKPWRKDHQHHLVGEINVIIEYKHEMIQNGIIL